MCVTVREKMSVFGGDSWAREAGQRKRRVNDLILGDLGSSSFKKLSNGKFSCLVCPNSPILDSPLMLSMHSNGARHQTALDRLKQRELAKQEEISMRIALSSQDQDNPYTHITCSSSSSKGSHLASKVSTEQTRKAASDVVLLNTISAPQSSQIQRPDSGISSGFQNLMDGVCDYYASKSSLSSPAEGKLAASQHNLDLKERREKELKYAAAGWKRDCHGKWYRDENVEFDSDEEDPNIDLA